MKPFTFKFFKNDFLSSISLFLISLPISAGIAVASKAPPEAGLFAAIFGALFLGFFSSSQLIVYGPAAGLSVFISAAVMKSGSFADVSFAIVVTGATLILLSRMNIHKLVHLFPLSVIKGMAAGIGFILLLKMIPHILGYDAIDFTSDNFFQSDGRNTISEIIYAFETMSSGPLLIAVISFGFIAMINRTQFWKKNNLGNGFIIVLVGIILAIIFNGRPGLALSPSQMLHIDSLQLSFHHFWDVSVHWSESLEISLIITSVILLEGLLTLEVFHKIDPTHEDVSYNRELLLLGIGNVVLGCIGALPIMPVLIRSTANVEFGAKSRLSVVSHGIWLLLSLTVYHLYTYIPMASIAVVLCMVGWNLIKSAKPFTLYARGKEQFIPFITTIILMLTMDLLWGILIGFFVGLSYALHSSIKRSMVLVDDGERYLLKFFKDVTFIHKSELKDCLDKVPSGKEVMINGSGNIFVDKEIEDWLVDYAHECQSRGCKVSFVKSKLAISELFRG